MATSDIKSGQLDNNDIIFPVPPELSGFTRADEYDLNTDAIGEALKLALTTTDRNSKYDPFLQVIDVNTGRVVADSDDGSSESLNSLIEAGQPAGNIDLFDDPAIPNSLTIDGSAKYKVRVTSVNSFTSPSSTYPYSLRASVPNGNVSLVARGSNFSSSPLTGNSITFAGKLESAKDFTFPVKAPSSGSTLADEFQVKISSVGEPIKISLSSTTNGFDPYVEVVNANTGEVVDFNDDGGGGKNALLSVPYQANTEYRIRVSSKTALASSADYSLQVSTSSGNTVTLTPRSGDTGSSSNSGGNGTSTGNLNTGTSTGNLNTGTSTGNLNTGTSTGNLNTGTSTGNLNTGTSTGNLNTGTSTGNLNTGTSPQIFGTPVDIATPTINAPGSGNPTGQSANTVRDLFYNLSDSKDDILLFSLPSTATGKQILALSGSDNITGTSGADTVNGMQGADTIDGGTGNDSLSGGKESDSLEGGAGNDDILGNNDNDTITGGEGNDTIRGGKEKDSLTGGGGDDFLYGDRHQDFLTGGDGNDTFVLAGGQIAALSLTDADVITDFKTGDKIGLTDGSTFGGLSFEDVSLTLNGQSAVNSTAIKAGSSYLGIVQGVAKSTLTANAFVIL